ncbi:MAG: hypothetical protein IPN97_12330 [Saprospiraceae bacterium]|nr:hypothetical protein [Saprospiraceae bacterium]
MNKSVSTTFARMLFAVAFPIVFPVMVTDHQPEINIPYTTLNGCWLSLNWLRANIIITYIYDSCSRI